MNKPKRSSFFNPYQNAEVLYNVYTDLHEEEADIGGRVVVHVHRDAGSSYQDKRGHGDACQEANGLLLCSPSNSLLTCCCTDTYWHYFPLTVFQQPKTKVDGIAGSRDLYHAVSLHIFKTKRTQIITSSSRDDLHVWFMCEDISVPFARERNDRLNWPCWRYQDVAWY